MFSNFSNTSDGCDTCATLDQAFGSTVSGYGNNNVVNQHANSVAPGSVGQNQGPAQNAARPALNNNVAVVAQQAQQQLQNQVQQQNAQQAQQDASNAQVAMNNMVKKAMSPKVVKNNGNNNSNNNKKKESFKNLNTVASNSQVQVNIPGKMILLNLGVVFLAALSLNECFKYYINRGIQRAEGQPHYYAGYAVACLVLVFVTHVVSKRNI